MGIIIDAIRRFATSKTGTKFYKWAASPRGENFLNNYLPTIETGVATAAYMWATERQDIEKRQKHMLQVQNVLSGIVGMALGSWLNKGVSKQVNKIIPYLDPKVVPDVHKVVGGLKVGLPLATTALLMRSIIPSFIAWYSGKVEDRRAAQGKFDVKA